MASLGLTRLSLICGVLSMSACADILGLGDFSFGEGGNTSTSTSGGNGSSDGGNGAGPSDGGNGGMPTTGGMGGVGGEGGRVPDICLDPVTYANRIVCDEPLLYLRFEESSPQQAMKNDSDLGIVPDGSYGGGATFTAGVPGIGGSALRQAAGRSEVGDSTAGLDFAPDDPYSVEVWVNSPSASTDTFAFIGTWNGSDQGHALFVFPPQPAATPMNLEYKRNAVPNTLVCSEVGGCALMADQWFQIVVTYDPASGGDVTLYVNGVSLGSKSLPNPLIVPSNAFAISGPGSEYVTFDELAVYQDVLSEAEVAAHYACAMTGDC